jgi:hypothetical protein
MQLKLLLIIATKDFVHACLYSEFYAFLDISLIYFAEGNSKGCELVGFSRLIQFYYIFGVFVP